jgi:hypothetical protein
MLSLSNFSSLTIFASLLQADLNPISLDRVPSQPIPLHVFQIDMDITSSTTTPTIPESFPKIPST